MINFQITLFLLVFINSSYAATSLNWAQIHENLRVMSWHAHYLVSFRIMETPEDIPQLEEAAINQILERAAGGQDPEGVNIVLPHSGEAVAVLPKENYLNNAVFWEGVNLRGTVGTVIIPLMRQYLGMVQNH